MFRFSGAVLVLAAIVAPVSAQKGGLPLSPGVHPGSPIGPGTQFLPTPQFRPVTSGMRGGHFTNHSSGFGYGGVGYGGYGYGGYGYSGFGYGYGGYGGYGYGAAPVVIEFFPPLLPRPRQRTVVLANEFPATLTVQFPAAATVWLNGQAVKGDAAEERVLTSPELKPGESFEFGIKARWEQGGKTYETLRTLTLGSGDHSRLIVVSGTEVK